LDETILGINQIHINPLKLKVQLTILREYPHAMIEQQASADSEKSLLQIGHFVVFGERLIRDSENLDMTTAETTPVECAAAPAFLGDGGGWNPGQHGEYTLDCQLGRRYAQEMADFLAERRGVNFPALRPTLKAMFEKAETGGVEVGFIFAIAEMMAAHGVAAQAR
jgi:hypothetical protein